MQAVLSAIFSREPFSASRNMFVSALVWLVLGMLFGFLGSLQFSVPDALTGYSILSFGRIRPAHINAILIGWLSMGYVACYFFLVPTLAKRNG